MPTYLYVLGLADSPIYGGAVTKCVRRSRLERATATGPGCSFMEACNEKANIRRTPSRTYVRVGTATDGIKEE